VRVASLVVLAIVLVASTGRAVSIWDGARDPRTARVSRVLIEAERARQPREFSLDTLASLPLFDGQLAMHAALILQEAGGEALGDPDVDYFLGDCLVVENRGRAEDAEGRRLLLRALVAAPDSPRAAHAWFQIAIASDRLGDFKETRRAYTEALRVEWDKNHRAAIYMNRGEAAMALGELREAQSDFETALVLADDSEVHALAAWDLAVTLSRQEDLPDALRRAWEAWQYRFRDLQGNVINALDLPTVSFTPDYNLFYYRALGNMAAAEHAENAEARKDRLELAMADLRRYLMEARPARDRWIGNVELALVWCRRRLGKR